MNQYLKEGDKAYENENYIGALLHLGKVWELNGSMDAEHIFKYGNSALQTFTLSEAERAFSAYIELGDTLHADNALFSLGQTQMLQGKYDLTIISMTQYISEYGGDDSLKT